MRRISAKYAKANMTLGRALYDSKGYLLFEPGTQLSEDNLSSLQIHGVGEIVINDPRVEDVPVMPLVAPEIEGEAIQALRQLMTESMGKKELNMGLLDEASKPIYAMTRDLFPTVIGEPNVAGCHSTEDYHYVQPVKVAGLSLFIGRMYGYTLANLASLGVAAIFMNIGYIVLPPKDIEGVDATSDEQNDEFNKHPWYGSEIIKRFGALDPRVAEAILHHHERWDGHGHPHGLTGEDISHFGRILAIVDTYYDLVSARPHRRALMPNQAVEFIMAYSNELFDPELVQLFARQIPIYPTGVTVKLNTGEMGIVSDANLGHVGRPKVRICYDDEEKVVDEPFDVDLSLDENQDRLVLSVLEY